MVQIIDNLSYVSIDEDGILTNVPKNRVTIVKGGPQEVTLYDDRTGRLFKSFAYTDITLPTSTDIDDLIAQLSIIFFESYSPTIQNNIIVADPPGNDGDLFYNNGGVFGGISLINWNDVQNTLTVETLAKIYIRGQLEIEDSTSGFKTSFLRTLTADREITIPDKTGTIALLSDLTLTNPGGADKSVQFNDGGVFGGNTQFVYDKTNHVLGIDWDSVNLPSSIATDKIQVPNGEFQTIHLSNSSFALLGGGKNRLTLSAGQEGGNTVVSLGTGYNVTRITSSGGAIIRNSLNLATFANGNTYFATLDEINGVSLNNRKQNQTVLTINTPLGQTLDIVKIKDSLDVDKIVVNSDFNIHLLDNGDSSLLTANRLFLEKTADVDTAEFSRTYLTFTDGSDNEVYVDKTGYLVADYANGYDSSLLADRLTINQATVKSDDLTSNRTHQLPDASGTLALSNSENIPIPTSGTLYKSWGELTVADEDSIFPTTDFEGYKNVHPVTSGWIPASVLKVGTRLRINASFHSGENTSSGRLFVNGINILDLFGAINAGQSSLEVVLTVTALGVSGTVTAVTVRTPSAVTSSVRNASVDLSSGLALDIVLNSGTETTVCFQTQIELI